MEFDLREDLHSVPASFGRGGALAVAAASLGVSAALFFLTGRLFGLGTAYFACASAIAALYAFGIFAVLFGGNAFVNAVFFYINVASAWLGFFGVACELQL